MAGFDLDQLRTLVAVLDAGSLTAAAPRVFLSQSSVSEQMRKLEERAGQPLLLRGKNGVTATPAGCACWNMPAPSWRSATRPIATCAACPCVAS